MLKKTEVYDITITLNDGKELNCLLLSKPDALTLAAIAEAESADAELTEAMAFFREVTIPVTVDPEEDINPVKSEIIVAGTLIGHVMITALPAYLTTKKRGPKPKPPAEAEAEAEGGNKNGETDKDSEGDPISFKAKTKAEAKEARAAKAKAKAEEAKAKEDKATKGAEGAKVA